MTNNEWDELWENYIYRKTNQLPKWLAKIKTEGDRLQRECRTWEKDALALSYKVYTIREFLRNAPLPPEEALDHIMELLS